MIHHIKLWFWARRFRRLINHAIASEQAFIERTGYNPRTGEKVR